MKDKIYEYVSNNGPSLTTDVSKYFKIESMYAGAYLSELVSNKKLRYTYKKIGGSALYYTDAQRHLLESRFNNQLSDKEQEVIDLIKVKKIIQEDMLDPVRRVILKDLKDFAIQIVVNYKDTKKTFWKWHLVTKEEAESVIKELFTGKKENAQTSDTNQVSNNARTSEINRTNEITKSSDVENLVEQSKINATTQTNSVENNSSQLNQSKSTDLNLDNKSDAKVETAITNENKKPEFDTSIVDRLVKENEAMKIQIQQLKSDMDLFKASFKQTLDVFKVSLGDEIKQHVEEELQNYDFSTLVNNTEGDNEDYATAVIPNATSQSPSGHSYIKYNGQDDDEFLVKLVDYFKKDSIVIDKFKIEKSNSVIQCIVGVKTPLGDMKYYCEARNIKKVNDGHLSNAFIQGQLNGLPVLFVSTGTLTKKAEEMLVNFKTMIVKHSIE